MKYSVSHILGAILAVPIALIVGFISMNFFVLDQWLDWLLMIGTYVGTYIPIQLKTSSQFLEQIGLTRREYKYVNKQINEARPKIKMLLSQYTKIRTFSDFKNINEINRLARTIYKTVQKQPAKFFKVDSFFFSHLDNTVNLINEYMHLVRMPHKSQEEHNQLNAARITLEELKRTLQADLRALNEENYHQMAVEVDLAKMNQLEHHEQVQVPVLKRSERERVER